jgi:hypothetical protein
MNVRRWSFLLFLCVACYGPTAVASAATVWTGPTVTFSKASGGQPTVPANQDHLTSLVWLTRGTSAGMFNIAPGQETSFAATSPKDTLWATSINNPLQTVTATNFAALSFDTWQNAYGGSGSLNTNITTHDAVVHLLTDDIYLNLRFTNFASGSGNGAFTYQRSTAAPEPSGFFLLLTGLVAMATWASAGSRHKRWIAGLTNSMKS